MKYALFQGKHQISRKLFQQIMYHFTNIPIDAKFTQELDVSNVRGEHKTLYNIAYIFLRHCFNRFNS
jgi:hypothetical protein